MFVVTHTKRNITFFMPPVGGQFWGWKKSITFSVSDLASTLNLLSSFYKPARATKININCTEVMGKVSRVLNSSQRESSLHKASVFIVWIYKYLECQQKSCNIFNYKVVLSSENYYLIWDIKSIQKLPSHNLCYTWPALNFHTI